MQCIFYSSFLPITPEPSTSLHTHNFLKPIVFNIYYQNIYQLWIINLVNTTSLKENWLFLSW